MGHYISKIVYNGKVLASEDSTLIKRVVYNGSVIWPTDTPIPPDSLVVGAYESEDMVGTFDDIKAGHNPNSRSLLADLNWTLRKVLLNAEQIWPKSGEVKDYLLIEKDHVILSEANNFSDTNTIYTNLTFNIT